MNYKSIFKMGTFLFASCLIVSGCHNKQKEETPSKELASGIVLDNLDTTVSPKDDFYQFACGGWVKNHPLPAEYSRYGSFDQLGESTEKQLNKLITDIAQQSNDAGSIAQKIGDFYNCGMDTQTINEQGDQPIRPVLQKIADVKSNKELTDLLIELHSEGYYPFFDIFGEASPNNSALTIAWLSQNGLGLGERDYYLSPDPKIKAGYLEMMEKTFELSNYGEMTNNVGKEKALANKVWNLETALAKIFIDKNELRDPVKTNNVLAIDDAAKLMTVVDLKKYMEQMVPNKVEEVNVVLSSYFTALNKLLATQDINTIKAYLAWNVINEAAPYLSDDFVDANFGFYGKVLSGKEENRERWKRVINTVSSLLGEPVGQLYVEKYFPSEAKERMLTLVDNLKIALGERIANLDWMSPATKDKAKEKLDAMIVKIGYPEKWRDYSGLQIQSDSYYANIVRATRFEIQYQLSKIGKPVDPTEWLMSPQTVNAYYNPTTNEICFPAAILQPPFFDMNADDAVNYGAIGVVIGHEMTHGFDDQGRQYDKMGNVNDWWTEEDSKKFTERTQVLVDHFNKIEVLPGTFANGRFTLGENIADNGGLNTSFVALQHAKTQGTVQENMDGFTANQRFFIAYAGVWANNIRDEEIARRTMTDPHSLGKWRVNGTLPHIDGFIEAFDIQPGDKMYLAPEQRARIW